MIGRSGLSNITISVCDTLSIDFLSSIKPVDLHKKRYLFLSRLELIVSALTSVTLASSKADPDSSSLMTRTNARSPRDPRSVINGAATININLGARGKKLTLTFPPYINFNRGGDKGLIYETTLLTSDKLTNMKCQVGLKKDFLKERASVSLIKSEYLANVIVLFTQGLCMLWFAGES